MRKWILQIGLATLLAFLVHAELPPRSESALNSVKGMDLAIPELVCCSPQLYCGEDGRFVRGLKLQNYDIDGVIRVLKPLKRLETLQLNADGITGISGVEYLSSIKTLSLAGNDINNVHELDIISGKLENLDLSFNSLATMNVLRKLRNLRTFKCQSCGFFTLPSIESLRNLRILDLSNNNLVAVPGLRKINRRLDALFLAGNPIPCVLLNRYYATSIEVTDRLLSERNCQLSCDCESGKKMVQTFGGPVCVDSDCQFSGCSIFDSYLDQVACNSPIFTNGDVAREECCKCSECEGITYNGDNFQLRRGTLRESGRGDITILRILAEKCIRENILE